MSESQAYQNPVAQLLKFDTPTNWQDTWIDYSSQFGLTKADVPELIRLSWDQDLMDGESAYSGVHALRAAAQLEPETAFQEYVKLLIEFPDDDFLHEEIYGISKQVGEIAIAPLRNIIDDSTQYQWVRVTAANGLEEIGKAHSELRQTCIHNLIETLQNYRDINNEVITSTLVSNLTQLKAVEAVDLIGEVFANTEVDEWVTGSWAAVQVELGLKKESDFSPKELEPKPPDYILAIREQQRQIEKARKNQRSLTELTVPARPAAKGFGASKQGNKSSKDKKKKR
jgi:hypothetical protein